MLVEPREALPRSSTFEFIVGKPGQLDLTTTYADDARPTLFTKAIYTIEGGDMLRYCVAPPGQGRPKALATQPGDGFTLVTLQRVADRPRRPVESPWTLVAINPEPAKQAGLVGAVLAGHAATTAVVLAQLVNRSR